jgi:hypothetical protein
MFDPAHTLAEFLDDHGVGQWVTDEFGVHQLVDDWIASFLKRAEELYEELNSENIEDTTRLRALRAATEGRKTMTVKKIRQIIDDD